MLGVAVTVEPEEKTVLALHAHTIGYILTHYIKCSCPIVGSTASLTCTVINYNSTPVTHQYLSL